MLLTILSANTPAAADSTLSVTWSAVALVALAVFFGVGYYLMELRGKKRDERYDRRNASNNSTK